MVLRKKEILFGRPLNNQGGASWQWYSRSFSWSITTHILHMEIHRYFSPPFLPSIIILKSYFPYVSKGRVKEKINIVENSTKGGTVTADFPLRKKTQKKHGIKTMDFA